MARITRVQKAQVRKDGEGTVKESEWPGDLRTSVLWDNTDKPVWTLRAGLKKIKKVKR